MQREIRNKPVTLQKLLKQGVAGCGIGERKSGVALTRQGQRADARRRGQRADRRKPPQPSPPPSQAAAISPGKHHQTAAISPGKHHQTAAISPVKHHQAAAISPVKHRWNAA